MASWQTSGPLFGVQTGFGVRVKPHSVGLQNSMRSNCLQHQHHRNRRSRRHHHHHHPPPPTTTTTTTSATVNSISSEAATTVGTIVAVAVLEAIMIFLAIVAVINTIDLASSYSLPVGSPSCSPAPYVLSSFRLCPFLSRKS